MDTKLCFLSAQHTLTDTFAASPTVPRAHPQQFAACPRETCRPPCPPRPFPGSPLDFSCSGEEPAPEDSKNVDGSVSGKEEPREEGERRQKMEQFVSESFEARDELFPEKSGLVAVSRETEGQEPAGLCLEEALKPATPGAACEGKELRAARMHPRGPASEPRTCGVFPMAVPLG